MRSLGGLFLLFVYVVSAQRSWQLVWSDDFNGNSLDTNKWSYETDCNGGGNNELQCYRTENVAVRDGTLRITTRIQHGDNGKQYSSGRITTARSAAWRYGRVEIRAKLPNGAYLWPAVWLMPKDNVYGSWAASGEIDVLENRGGNTRDYSGAIHYGGSWPNNVYQSSGFRNHSQDLSSDFHTFSIDWTPERIRYTLDDREYWRTSLLRTFNLPKSSPYKAFGQPFDQRFFLIINMAVGGGFFGAQAGALTQDMARRWSNPVLTIDYVKVWELRNPGSWDCNTIYRNLPCRTWTEDPNQMDGGAMGGIFDWVCGNFPEYCVDIQPNAKYGKCNVAQRLSWIMNKYYQRVRADQGNSGCNFNGLGRVVG